MLLAFWIWYIITLPLLFLPLYLAVKRKPMTFRDLIFITIGIWLAVGHDILKYLFN